MLVLLFLSCDLFVTKYVCIHFKVYIILAFLSALGFKEVTSFEKI